MFAHSSITQNMNFKMAWVSIKENLIWNMGAPPPPCSRVLLGASSHSNETRCLAFVRCWGSASRNDILFSLTAGCLFNGHFIFRYQEKPPEMINIVWWWCWWAGREWVVVGGEAQWMRHWPMPRRISVWWVRSYVTSYLCLAGERNNDDNIFPCRNFVSKFRWKNINQKQLIFLGSSSYRTAGHKIQSAKWN